MASSIDNAFITQYGRRKPKMPKKKIAKKPDKARQHLTESERRASSLSFVTVDPKKRKRPFTPSEPSDEEIKKRTRKYHKKKRK